MKTYSILLACLLIIGGCTKSEGDPQNNYEIQIPESPLPKGDRRLNIAPSEGENGFSSTFQSMKTVGVDLVELNLEWTYFEEEKGVYKDPDGLLQAVGFYADNGIEIGISLATINTIKRTDPSYLNHLSYNDPEYIDAFVKLMVWILESIPSHVTVDYISLGNEIDFVLQGSEWQDFKVFLEIASDRIHSGYPEIKCGAKMTITHGLLGNNRQLVLDLIEISDVAMLNYYPSGDDFKVFAIEKIKEQIEQVIDLVDKEIYFTELGFQSGVEYCNSSEEKQAAFYHEFFKMWDLHADVIKFVQINWMHDISDISLDFYEQYYGSSQPGFLEFLSTLGLKNHDETAKLAWGQVMSDANIRGWE